MHDIRFIRDHPEQFTAAMQRRSVSVTADVILDIDRKRRSLQAAIQDMQSRRNAASKDIGVRKAKGEDADDLIAEVNRIKAKLPELENEEMALAETLDGHLLELPNILDNSVPDGVDEAYNSLLRTGGTIPTFDFVPQDHVAIGEALGQMDFALGAKLAGARFVVLSGQLARLERALAGRDTRGMIRQHQFSKVELVSICHPDHAADELERMTNCAETILQSLELPYRVIKLCSGDTGFSAQQTYDIEVWLAGQDDGRGMYREISSCSNCGPFQARRMRARFRDSESGETRFVHTLNGSGLAVGRTLIAVLENGQQSDGSVVLPKALHSYMGTDRLQPMASN